MTLRVMIVDDSALMRRALRSLLEADHDLIVAGEAVNGREALDTVTQVRPDVIIMDVRMPVMDGIETTEQLMAYHPTPILVLTSSLSHFDVDITFRMLGAGALDVMEKPSLGDAAAINQVRQHLVRKVKLLARVKVVTHLRGRRKEVKGEPDLPAQRDDDAAARLAALPSPPQAERSAPLPVSFPVVVIGASTGGPRVVRQLLSELPVPFGAAVVVVQHIATGFSAGMAEWLQISCPLPLCLAQEGDVLQPGMVYIAPDRLDLLIRPGGRLHLSDRPLLLQRPAVDVVMQAAADVFGRRTIGVLLTGMGRDGAIGMQAIKRVGGLTIAQDEATCAIFGMPRAAIGLGVVDAVLPPDDMVPLLRQRVRTLTRRP
jgi:two-component system chemotaxis response regulator CheB